MLAHRYSQNQLNCKIPIRLILILPTLQIYSRKIHPRAVLHNPIIAKTLLILEMQRNRSNVVISWRIQLQIRRK